MGWRLDNDIEVNIVDINQIVNTCFISRYDDEKQRKYIMG